MPVLVLGAGCDRVPGAVGLVERICCSLNGDSYGVLIISAELAVRAFETGCRCWVPVLGAGAGCSGAGAGCCELVPAPGAGAGRGAGAGCCGLCAWWRHGAGAGWQCAWWRQRAPLTGRRYRSWVLVLGAVSWRAGARCWCRWCPLLTVK